MQYKDLSYLAARQYGVFTYEQALQKITKWNLQTLLKKKIIRLARRGVYVFTSTPSSWEQQVMIATLSRSGAVASHSTAACLWGLSKTDQIHITVRRSSCSKMKFVTLHQVDLEENEMSHCQGIPVTSIPRTLLDLAGEENKKQLGKYLDEALRMKLVSIKQMSNYILTVQQGKNGLIKLAELIDDRNDGKAPTESDLEIKLFSIIKSSGLPLPERQVWVTRTRRLDIAYPQCLLALEADGFEWHKSLTSFNRDRNSDVELAAMGWQVLRFTNSTDPDQFIDYLRTILNQRATIGTSVPTRRAMEM